MMSTYRALLANFELVTPLREPSDLAGDQLADRLLVMSEGLLGELAEVIRRAAEEAIRTGHERIDRGVLDSLYWVLPSQRCTGANSAY